MLLHPPAYLDIKPDPGYPQQYGPGGMQVRRALAKIPKRNMRSATFPLLALSEATGASPRSQEAGTPLWMKFPGRNIQSTRHLQCFRRSGRRCYSNIYFVHRLPHRLCTSYATYCTGYPQRLRHAGFAAGATGATVAGYLFFAARIRAFQLQPGRSPTPLFHTLCGKTVESGDKSRPEVRPTPRLIVGAWL